MTENRSKGFLKHDLPMVEIANDKYSMRLLRYSIVYPMLIIRCFIRAYNAFTVWTRSIYSKLDGSD